MMNQYIIETDGDMVIVYERTPNMADTQFNKFQFDKHVFERAVGIDVLLGVWDLAEDENFLDLLDQYREY